ncbi:hypothetical protein ACIOFR_39975, partial [Kitasatospora sp. NPDC088346]
MNNAAESALWRGCDEEAGELLEETEVLARHAKCRWLQASCDVIRLELDFVQGRWAGLDERIDSYVSEAPEDSPLQVEPQMLRALLDVAHGQWSRARQRIGRPLEYLNVQECSLVCTAALARIDLAEGNPSAAWATVQPGLDAVRHKGMWVWSTDLVPTAVQAALACGLHGEAEDLVAQAEQGIEGFEAPAAPAEVRWARGLLAADARPAEAVEDLERARGEFAAIGRVHRAAASPSRPAASSSPSTRPGPPAASRRPWTFTRLGATADADQCRRALRESGQEPTAHRVTRRGHGTGLGGA